jgi:ElaB/YqjD/DUF883 family membrane-anchored ribosome-binding protein
MTKLATFDEAFKILDQAIADQQTPSLGSLVTEEIVFLKAAARSEASEVALELGRGQNELNGLIRDLTSLSSEHVTELVDRVDAHVRENPLLYIAGAAAGAIALGLLFSQMSAKKESRARGVVHSGEDTSFESGVYA